MTRHEREDAALTAVYAQIPDVGCKGLCADACGPVPVTPREAQRMIAAGGKRRGGDDLTCPYLADGQCTVYDVRPLICRMYGAMEGLTCPHGCAPDVLLPDAATDLLKQAAGFGAGMIVIGFD